MAPTSTAPPRQRGRAAAPSALALGAVLLLLSEPASAIGSAENEEGDISFEAIGSQRLTGAYLYYREMPAPLPQESDGLLGSVSRLVLTGDLGWTWSYEANLFLDLSRLPTGLVGGAFASAGSYEGVSPYRTEYLSWRFWEDGTIRGTMGIDRLSFEALAEPVVLTVGRFPINYSVTNIFTPNDFFAPFTPTAINTVYKPGVDALRFNLALGAMSGLEVAQVAGYRQNGEPSWSRSALLARANTVFWDFEWALLGGKLAERWVSGLSFQGEIGPLNFRGEGHVGFADQDGDGTLDGDERRPTGRDDVHLRAAGGIDVPFEWHNATIAAEYAFLSDGVGEPARYLERAAQLFPDDQPFGAEHYVGASVAAEIIPILRASLSGLFNPQDLSGMAFTSLNYSISDEADFVAGLLLPWGKVPTTAPPPTMVTIESEFGLQPITTFAETRFYF